MFITKDNLRKERKKMEVEKEVINMCKNNPYQFFLVTNGESGRFWRLVKSVD